jgi:hypothetical protein
MKISLLLLSFIFRYMKEQNKSHKSERKGKLTFLLTSLCSACTFMPCARSDKRESLW